MIAIPIMQGSTTNSNGEPEVFLPINLELIPKESGNSQGYFRQHDGITKHITGNGIDRGGINWNGRYFRVSGNDLIEIFNDDTIAIRGTIPGTDKCRFDYSFDALSISNGDSLYYYSNEKKMQQASVNNFGYVIDHKFMDGYFFTTDGANIVQSDLTDKTKASPLKYGSSELDPDSIIALQRIRGELYALNRYTIEVFDNTGGEGFVLSRISGAQIMKGCVGLHANAVINDALVFIGSGRGEKLGVYLAGGGQAKKISIIDVDNVINGLSESQKQALTIDVKVDSNGDYIYIHLEQFSYMYNITTNLWSIVKSNDNGFRGKNLVLWNGNWHCGDAQSNDLGVISMIIKDHFSERVNYEFRTLVNDNQGTGFIVHHLELVFSASTYSKPGSIGLSLSNDQSMTFKPIRYKTVKTGTREQRLVWLKNGIVRNNATVRFNWNSDIILTIKKLMGYIEPLQN